MEEALKKEKAEKERLEQELEIAREEIGRLKKEQTTAAKRKQEEDEVQEAKRKKDEETKVSLLLWTIKDELKCTICNEVFFSPMTVNCGHVFCGRCLNEWKHKCPTQMANCPLCRTEIKDSNRSLYLENLIDLLFTVDVDEQVEKKRQALILERKASQTSTSGVQNVVPAPDPRLRGPAVVVQRARHSRQQIFRRPPNFYQT